MYYFLIRNILLALVTRISYLNVWGWIVKNQSSIANWFTSIGTVGAVIVALWQTIRSDKQKRPEILMNIRHHGVYGWYYDRSGESWNTFTVGNYGNTPATELSVEVEVDKAPDCIQKWLEENNLFYNEDSKLELDTKINNLSKIEEMNESSNWKKYKVEIQDYLFPDEEVYIWFPREFKELYASIVKIIESKDFTDDDLDHLNRNRPIFRYHFQYKFRNSKGEKIIKIDPQFKFYNDTDKNGLKMVKAMYCIANN